MTHNLNLKLTFMNEICCELIECQIKESSTTIVVNIIQRLPYYSICKHESEKKIRADMSNAAFSKVC